MSKYTALVAAVVGSRIDVTKTGSTTPRSGVVKQVNPNGDSIVHLDGDEHPVWVKGPAPVAATGSVTVSADEIAGFEAELNRHKGLAEQRRKEASGLKTQLDSANTRIAELEAQLKEKAAATPPAGK